MKRETLEKLREFIDLFEEECGDIEGFEVKLEKPLIEEEGRRQGYSSIKEFVVLYLKRETIEIDE